MLKIYNTLSHRKEDFRPIKKDKVGIYVCGLTVYDYTHLGHARMLVAFDVIVRHLRAKGMDVHYVRNITDVDDKSLSRAAENKEVFSDLTARFIHAMHEDEKALSVLPPDSEPRATSYIPEMINIIEILIKKIMLIRQIMGMYIFQYRIFLTMANFHAREWMNFSKELGLKLVS